MFASRSGNLARLRMRVSRQLLRWHSGEERSTKKYCVVGKGKTKAGSSVGLWIRDRVGAVGSSPSAVKGLISF